jgi:hypothetical protein
MSWVKTNFLWMQYRSGWNTKPHQEASVGLWLKRSLFEQLLSNAIGASNYSRCEPDESWQARKEAAGKGDRIVMQWDPDHHPDGSKVAERRAIQLGLKGEWRDRVFDNSSGELLGLVDLSEFVAAQDPQCLGTLHVAKEREYPLSQAICDQIGAGPFSRKGAHSTTAKPEPEPEPEHPATEADRLSQAVSAIDVEGVRNLLAQGADPNALRSPGGEEIYQPDQPLKMVMFRLSDCLLQAPAHAQLATIASTLLTYGADPKPAMQIAEWRYGPYPGTEDGDTWQAWHLVVAAATAEVVAA